MRAKLLYDCRADPNHPSADDFPDGIKPVGTIIDHPEAFKLVQQGIAEPADEECAKQANMTEAAWRKAVRHHARLRAGIHPDDFGAWERGEMVGYNPDGSWKPGPNSSDATSIDTMDVYDEDDDEP
jgi:hypothetical protein